MPRSRRVTRTLVVGLGFGAGLVLGALTATPAAADIESPCQGRGLFREAADLDAVNRGEGPDAFTTDAPLSEQVRDGTDTLVDPTNDSGPFTVPYEAAVAWEGSMGSGEVDERSSGGVVKVVFPPLVRDLIPDDWGTWDWSSTGVDTGDNGIETYELPDAIPGGTEFAVTGFHNDPAIPGTCEGFATLKLPGSAFNSPVTFVVIIITAGSTVLMITAAIQKVPAPGPGLGTGGDVAPEPIFADGFESGDTSAWTTGDP